MAALRTVRQLAWSLCVSALVAYLPSSPACASIEILPRASEIPDYLADDFSFATWVVLARVVGEQHHVSKPSPNFKYSNVWTTAELEVLEHFIPDVTQPTRFEYLPSCQDSDLDPARRAQVGDTAVVFLVGCGQREGHSYPKEIGWSPRLKGDQVLLYHRTGDLDRDSLLALCRELGEGQTPEAAKHAATLAVRGRVTAMSERPQMVWLRVSEAHGSSPLPTRHAEIAVMWEQPMVGPRHMSPVLVKDDEVVAFLVAAPEIEGYVAPLARNSFWRVAGDRCVIDHTERRPTKSHWWRRVQAVDALRSVPRERVLRLMREGW
ncbi:MAG: hypothetical protein U0527_11960 [Candidatus Eisenbacteria bacterium]